ncbi:MAG: TVP38/TMEM64 family protein [Rubritepida sp.]|nr:TVP38/TMEM64 family protein [Rubritepida sp.]
MKRVWIGLGLVAIVLAIRFTGLADLLSLDTLARHRAALTGWVAANPALSALAYLGAYTAAAAFAVPGAVVLTLAGGFLFGAVLGTVLTVLAATLGATLLFLLAGRVFGADALRRLGPRAEALARGIQANAWSYLLVLRLVPLFPFFLVNLVPAFAGVRLPVFIGTTLLGIIPGTAVFSLSGAGLGRVLDAGGTPSLSGILTPEIIAALCGLAGLALLAIPLRKRFAG